MSVYVYPAKGRYKIAMKLILMDTVGFLSLWNVRT
jgi:hypothetical protein